MNNIYDILLNFNDTYYDFYEWKNDDNLVNVKKIPIIKLNKKDYINFKNYNIIIKDDFLNSIKSKTTFYDYTIKDKYICLFMYNNDVFGAKFNEEGKLIQKSDLLIDEKEEAADESYNIEETKISYECLKKDNKNLVSRLERECKEKIKDFLDLNVDNHICLKYLYYEYFDKESNNIEYIKEKLYGLLNKEWNYKLQELYKVILLYNKIKN